MSRAEFEQVAIAAGSIQRELHSTNLMQNLIKRWRKDAEQYQKQVEEARKAGTPHDQMLSFAVALRQCAKELEILIPPKPERWVSFWYMRDNHTFIELTGDSLDQIIEKAKAIERMNPCGMLCSPVVCDLDWKNEKRLSVNAHSGGRFDPEMFQKELILWRASVEADAEVMDLIKQGKVKGK